MYFLFVVLLLWPIALWGMAVIDGTELAAFTALILGTVGIFKDEALSYFRKPIIGFNLTLKSPASHKTIVKFRKCDGNHGAYPAYYLRLLVSNLGDVRAENVEVLIRDKYFKNGDNFELDNNFQPLNLLWSHSAEVTKKSIVPKLSKYCDFGHIKHPDFSHLGEVPAGRTNLFLALEVLPNTQTHVVTPGIYRFKMIVTSDNAASVEKTYEINFAGRWYENETEMLNTGVTAKEVST